MMEGKNMMEVQNLLLITSGNAFFSNENDKVCAYNFFKITQGEVLGTWSIVLELIIHTRRVKNSFPFKHNIRNIILTKYQSHRLTFIKH